MISVAFRNSSTICSLLPDVVSDRGNEIIYRQADIHTSYPELEVKGISDARMTGNSDVMPLGSSSRAPLLAPSPLRTGLEGFPFIRLEHLRTPPWKTRTRPEAKRSRPTRY